MDLAARVLFILALPLTLCCIHAEVLSLQFFLGMVGELPFHHSQFPNFLEMTTQKKKKKSGSTQKRYIEISNSSVCGDYSTF